ncbi:hypothetical protein [Actibacterium ureilyticum]|uniref:hypothetical protein n=1 Tax=Actibacterium ureilyticum TaxID=1590614 RepID=UPI000BAAA563|nr:hypothetical protein [Actibacterium ureilyticum]
MSDKHDDDILNAYFAEMRADAPVPSQDLLARIVADAEREQPKAAPKAAAPGGGRVLSWWRDLPGRMALAGGLTAATVAGVWIGYSPPATLDLLNVSFLDADQRLTEQMTLELDSYYAFEG